MWALEQMLGAEPVPGLPPGCAPEVRELIEAAREAIDVFDFRPVAERNLLPAHYTYLSMGVQHEVTLRANRSAFERFQLRPRRLVDVRELDTSTEILGTRLSSPILLAPAGSQRAFHPEAELAVARAARRKDHLQILSTGSSKPLEEVADALGTPPWFQLYTARVWPVTRRQLKSAEEVGCPAVVLTVDIVAAGDNRDRIRRYRRDESPECQSCHASLMNDSLRGISSRHRSRRLGQEPPRPRLGLRGSDPGRHVDEALHQGNPHPRGCDSLRGARGRRHRGLEPRRSGRRQRPFDDRGPPRNRASGRRAHSSGGCPPSARRASRRSSKS
jgi:hypothetical protein